MKHLIYTLLLTLSLALISEAATAQSRHSIGYRLNWYNYTTPLGSDNFSAGDIYGKLGGFGAEFDYYNRLFGKTYLNIPVKIGVVSLPYANTVRDQALGNIDLALQQHFVKEGKLFRPYIMAGVGSAYNFDAKDFALNFPVGIGLDLRILNQLYLTGQTQHRFSTNDHDGWQHSLGLRFMLGSPTPPPPPAPADRDGDGIIDNLDNCPDVPGPAKTKGCPDRDKDGIADADDDCPEVAGIASMKGCPDRDGDGITDADDACPTEKGLAKFNGCPDTDNDGIMDKDDKCPREPGPISTGGCPDRDSDGVADRDDACPDKAGEAAHKGCPDTDKDGIYDNEDRCVDVPGPISNKGCPVMTKEDKATVELAIRQVQFETGKATLLNKSLPVLDNIADVLKRYPNYNLKISGHTDNVGDDNSNLSLSKNRAKTCFDYLVSKGVDANRMSHEGYGETQPVADNKTAEGRAQNRRTEFELIQK